MVKNLGKYVRTRGHNYELAIVKELKALGYEEVFTSRSESKRLDDSGVDILIKDSILMPQCKISSSTPLFSKYLNKTKCNVLFWNKQSLAKVNNTSDGEYIVMTKEFFYNILKQLKL